MNPLYVRHPPKRSTKEKKRKKNKIDLNYRTQVTTPNGVSVENLFDSSLIHTLGDWIQVLLSTQKSPEGSVDQSSNVQVLFFVPTRKCPLHDIHLGDCLTTLRDVSSFK